MLIYKFFLLLYRGPKSRPKREDPNSCLGCNNGQKQTSRVKRANRVEGSKRCRGQFLWDDGARGATATFSQQLPDACLGATLEGLGSVKGRAKERAGL